MTEKSWDPYRQQEPVEPKQRQYFSLPTLVPVTAQESFDVPEQVTLAIKPMIPHRLAESRPWWRQEARDIERAVLMLTTWILSVSFVFVGLVVGFIITHLWELSMIILGWSA